MSARFERVAIAGVGLIGASLGLAGKCAGVFGEVVGFGRSLENLRRAQADGAIDRIARTALEAVGGADLVVLAAPVGACAALAREFRPHAVPGAILTDVASVKATLVPALDAAWAPGPVVGGHPIAGGDASGAAAARVDLFRGRRCILTPGAQTDRAALARVRALWEALGARVEEMAADVHDALLARISHLPHLVAAALVAASAEGAADGRRALDYAGTGFRDTTRIAAGRAELWRDIFLANREPVLAALATLDGALGRLRALVEAGDARGLEVALDAAAALRRGLAEDR